MGIITSREAGVQSPSSPTHSNTGDLTSVLGGVAITTNVTPTTTIKRSTSASKSLQNNWKTPQQQQNHHVRQASVRNRAAQPMPDHNELDKRFAKVLVRISIISIFYFFFVCLSRTNWVRS